ncbi:Peptidoglycan lipid II flippase MurJ [Olavius sp. associated proteobacterium Delta 1]|nr:Peptidoglycan lipid II flippase MurJ [Olavius sp. associated proteobacterium Delta 1]
MSEKSRVIKAAGVVGAATLLSRILGFVRDAVIAWFFGAGFSSDAFIAAFRIPNLLRRLFAEGSLSSAFIPVFTEYVVHNDQDEAFSMARSAFRLLGVVLFIVTLGGILLSPWVVRLIAPGFDAEKIALTVTLTRWMFPYFFCIGLVALCMGILNVLGHFAAPAIAPVVLNLSVIGSVLYIAPAMTTPVIGLALGVLIGGFLQLALQLPILICKGFRFWEKAKLMHPGLKKVGISFLPIILGGAVYQINIVVGTLLGSLLSEGSVTYLYFADRLVQFPLGVFAIAASTAVLPSLSRHAAARELDELKHTFAHALKLVFFISIPAMVGLIVLREHIVVLLFQRGEFDAAATQLTTQAVLYYSIGLWAFSAVRIVAAAFFALQDARTPVRIAIISIIANIFLGVILMKPLAHGGLALATSLASMLNLGLLMLALRTRLGSLGWINIAHSAAKTFFSSLVMGTVVWATTRFFIPLEGRTTSGLLVGVAASIGIGLCIYAVTSFMLKSQELSSVLTEARKGILNK